jgi:hypothetical protein
MEPCNLACRNNGVCRKGAKDVSMFNQFDVLALQEINQTYSDQFEHCVCPKGYVGLECEFEMELCPGNNHICMNGADCIPIRDGSGLKYGCDCDTATTNSKKYAGQYCEFESQVFCTIDGSMPTQTASSNAFCTNHGICRSLIEDGSP